MQGTGMLLGRGDKRTWRGKVSANIVSKTIKFLLSCFVLPHMPAAHLSLSCAWRFRPILWCAQIFKGSFGKASLLPSLTHHDIG